LEQVIYSDQISPKKVLNIFL